MHDEDKIVYKKVIVIFENEISGTLEIETNKGVIRCTPSHPFYLGDGNYRDASQLKIGNELFTNNAESVFIKSIQLIDETIKVYNIEVEDSHCYFVGEEGILVHNSCGDVFEGLSKVAKKKVANLEDYLDDMVMEAIKKRGGKAGSASVIGSDYTQKTVREIAELAAKGDDVAETALKIVKQASKKAQKY